MNLNVCARPKGRKYLTIVKSYRDPETKKPRTKQIQAVGYLDVLEKQYTDPIAHFKEVARQMTEDENAGKTAILKLSMDEELQKNTDSRKNYGYAAIIKVYHDLLLHEHFASKSRYQKFKFNTNSIMLLLVISRILSPGSKKKAFDERKRYFERFAFEEHDIYRALSHFARITESTQQYIHEQIAKKYRRDTSVVYFDTTNFYFEIDEQDDLRKRGVSKEHRPNPIVQMGLAMDRNGVPISYKIFPGNKHDSETFKSIIGDICRKYETGRVVVVGDMGIITGDNIWYLVGGKPHKPMHGYVFSFSVRGGTKDFRKYVLDDEGYTVTYGGEDGKEPVYKIKERRIARQINVSLIRGGKAMTVKKTVYEKQIVFWGKKYADKAKAEREVVLKKAMAFIKDPSKYKRHTDHGSAKYILGIDKQTGEVSPDQILTIDFEALKEEEKLDGYYAIVTSEHEMSSSEIVDTYRGLWEIEETFSITKGDLKARPIYVSLKEHIEAHFLTCFISLVIVRLLQKLTDKIYPAKQIIEALRRIECSNEQDNIYLFNYRSKVSDKIGVAVGVDFSKKRMRLGEIKKSLGALKK
jgi:transposase